MTTAHRPRAAGALRHAAGSTIGNATRRPMPRLVPRLRPLRLASPARLAALASLGALAGLAVPCVRDARAALAPLKPHGQLVQEVVAFLMSDVGNGGIRTMDGAPQGARVPPYFYHYSIQHDDDLPSPTTGYPGYASISYPWFTASIGIDAFLAYWAYSGDPQALARARAFADWLLPRRTPAGDLFGNWPYSTQTDGTMGGGFDGDAVMSDKPAMFALRCLRLHDITGEAAYLDGATQIARTYVATQHVGGPAEDGRWPFRVRPSDGLVRQDFTSDLIPAISLLEALEHRAAGQGFATAAARAWAWLWANPLDPSSANYQRWEGFYEDITPADETGKRDHYGAEETVLGLLQRGQPGDVQKAIEVFGWSTSRYLAADGFQNGYGAYAPSILEWDAWMNTTYSATGQWAYVNLRLDEATRGTPLHDPTWRTRAIQALHTLTYGQGAQPLPHDGRMLTTIRELVQPLFGSETWYEQSLNTVKYMLLSFGLAPELAPAGEDHLVGFSGSELTAVQYSGDRIVTRWSGPGRAFLRLQLAPRAVLIDGIWQTVPVGDLSGATAAWTWQPDPGVCTIAHPGGDVVIALSGATAVGEPPSSGDRPADADRAGGDILLPPHPSPANPATTLDFVLGSGGRARIAVHDLRGRTVCVLLDAERPAGFGRVVWRGTDAAGRAVASGTYLVRMETVSGAHVRNVTLAR